MKEIFIAAALSALVWPGTGQLYNREFKKGAALVFLTVLLGFAFVIGAGRDIARHAAAGGVSFGPEQARAMLESVIADNPAFYRRYSLLLSATWVFSIVDAVLGARDRLAPPPPQEPS